MIYPTFNSTPSRLAGVLYALALALLLLPSSSAAADELTVDAVPGQYILFLNPVAVGNYLADRSSIPDGLQKYLNPFLDAFAQEETRLLAASPQRDRTQALAELWRTPAWRDGFARAAEQVWSSILQNLTLPPPIDTSGTSVLLELDESALPDLSDRTEELPPGLLATSAVQDRTALLVLQPNYRLAPAKVPNDPLFHAQWALKKTKVPEAWDRTEGTKGVTVAVIDSGYDSEQVELQANLWPGDASTGFRPGRGFCEENLNLGEPCDPDDIGDETGHGTAIAGIIGAAANDDLRVAGASWHVSLMILKVLGRDNRGSVWDVAEAIRFAADHGADVITLALGGRPESNEARGALLSAISDAASLGHRPLVVVAAGNENLDLDEKDKNLIFPASFKVTHDCKPNKWCFENLLVVGATDRQDEKASFSNHGTEVVDLGAPGVRILTTGFERRRGVAEVTGTSAAAALVAGVAALVNAARSSPCDPEAELCFELVKQRLLEGAEKVSALSGCFTDGRRLDACEAVRTVDPPGPGACP